MEEEPHIVGPVLEGSCSIDIVERRSPHELYLGDCISTTVVGSNQRAIIMHHAEDQGIEPAPMPVTPDEEAMPLAHGRPPNPFWIIGIPMRVIFRFIRSNHETLSEFSESFLLVIMMQNTLSGGDRVAISATTGIALESVNSCKLHRSDVLQVPMKILLSAFSCQDIGWGQRRFGLSTTWQARSHYGIPLHCSSSIQGGPGIGSMNLT
mmetsp:Transcript_70469/g.158378  ORF Transcript_70469/g.158378 Transcript_70469/m.158378 type:complete len:208 (+) Transcript_70469:672-1295(+)